MLSLLSLLLASGTVLRADTERWTPLNYPNPKNNHTACNTQENSTLCDPDHILTDQWRTEINQNIQKQMKRLTEANVPLSEKAPVECINRTEGVLVYVLLAKRIWTLNNQSITGNDLTKFGDDLAKQYGLNDLSCQTFLLLIGIEDAKLAYVRVTSLIKYY
uniref:Secreted protein n=1 Tax=Meloidogyne hapla TaxID=6305 RepID=A0A1I8AWN0_MELHA